MKKSYNIDMKRSVCFLLSLVCTVVAAYTVCLRSLSTSVFAATDEKMRVVVDAGHGGMDGGVTGRKTGVKESDLNLEIAFCLKDVLEDAGFLVTLTRKTQFGLTENNKKWTKQGDMRCRKEIIKESGAALVVSIHQNAYPSVATRGGQVFYLKGQENSKNLALCVQERINALYSKDGVKERVATPSKYYILGCLDVPSIIVECGFLSNAKDEELLLSKNYQKSLAESIFSGIMGFYSGENGS